MAFNTSPGRAEYTAAAAQTIFTFTFKIFETSDIKVYLTPVGQTAEDAADILIETTDYTVAINGDNGGDITLVSGTTLNDSITLVRSLPTTRETEYQQNGDLTAQAINEDQDYQTYLILDGAVEIERALVIPDSVQSFNTEIPSPISNKLLVFNNNADGFDLLDTSSTGFFNDAFIVESIAAMTGVDPNQYGSVIARGYYAANDGGGGLFNYDATQSAVNNGCTIFNGWVRQYSGAIISKWGGAVGDKITDDTTAMQNVLAVANSTNNTLLVKGFTLVKAELTVSCSMIGDGIGLSGIIFDQTIASNGLFLAGDGEWEQITISGLSILCKGANGLTAIKVEKGTYFTETNSIKISDVLISDEGLPQESVSGFLTQYTWGIGIDTGDVQGCELTNIYIYSNYDITIADTGSSIGIKLDGTDTQLFTRLDAIWINACRTGISLQDKSFGHINNVDITRSWIGVEATTVDNFNEVFFNNIAINSQKFGLYVDGFVRLFVDNMFVNRHSDGLDQGHTWYGVRYLNVTKSFLTNIHSQPNIVTTPPQVGFYFESCGDLRIDLIAGSGLDTGAIFDNVSNFIGVLQFADTAGKIAQLQNNARAINLRLGAGESFVGTWWSEDGSLDMRNIELNLTSATEYGTQSATKFIEKLAIVDKDNIGGADEGFAWTVDNGDFRLKSISSGVETNVILLNRSGTTIEQIDFRTTKIKLNNGPSWESGNGSPEGVKIAVVGSFYSRTDGGASTSFYVKESGTGNTGWIAK